MKKKLLIFGVLLLVLVILGVWAVPVFADGASNPNQSTQNTQQVKKIGILIRLLMVQDESKVDAFLAKAESAGKITAAQVTAIKEMWTNHHEQFKRGSALVRLLQANNGANVQTVLDKAFAAGKINKDQAQKIMTLWHKLHNK